MSYLQQGLILVLVLSPAASAACTEKKGVVDEGLTCDGILEKYRPKTFCKYADSDWGEDCCEKDEQLCKGSACYGDISTKFWNDMNCQEIFNDWTGINEFCNNPNIVEKPCCESWKKYCAKKDDGTCNGDASVKVYKEMTCAQMLSNWGEGDFCVNDKIAKGPCCKTWADVCSKFQCKSGEKISDEKLCDGTKDCSDGSDETSDCFRCHNGEKKIRKDWLCNGKQDCSDGSDESGKTCFKCDDKKIRNQFVCNDKVNCEDESDEMDCKGQEIDGDFVVEILVVLDPVAQANYLVENNNNKADADKSLLKDIDYYITEMNRLYKNFDKSDFKMRVSKRGVLLLEKDIFEAKKLPANELGQPRVYDEWAMEQIEDYMWKTGAQAKYNYDHLVFFTGYDIGDPNEPVIEDRWGTGGKAWTDKVCDLDGNNYSIVEYSGTYVDIIIAAHEIAHNLGSDGHDGVKKFIMASQMHWSDERWIFSYVSMEKIANNIRKLNKQGTNCLLKPGTSGGYDIPNAEVTAQLANPNVVCTRALGKDWVYNPQPSRWTGSGAQKGDILCNKLSCKYDGVKSIQYNLNSAFSSDGMACGKNKVCYEGTCQADASSSIARNANNEECLFGDTGLKGYCESLKNKNQLYMCSAENRITCCATAPTVCPQENKCKHKNDWWTRCKNDAKCIHRKWICDGDNDCGDNSDEENCGTDDKKRMVLKRFNRREPKIED